MYNYTFLLFVDANLSFLAIGCAKNDGGGSDGEEGSVFYHASLAVAQNLVVHEGARIAGAVAEHVFQLALLVAAHVDYAVVHVYARVHGLDGAGYAAAFLVSADGVVAHLQGDDLLVCEHVLDDYDGSVALLVGLFVYLFLLASLAKLRHTHPDAELLVAVGAYENEALALLVFCFVECDEIVAFGATYSFHENFFFLISILMWTTVSILSPG